MDPTNPTLAAAPPTPPVMAAPPAFKRRAPRGYLRPTAVRGFAFWTITICILASVVVSIVAIWNPDQSQALWKTLATSLVIASGCGVFAAVNTSLGASADEA